MGVSSITFDVHGEPAPGGSKNAFAMRRRDGSIVTRGNGYPVIKVSDAGKGNKRWRRSVAIMARKAMGFQSPFEGAIRLTVGFFFNRPIKHFRANGLVRESVRGYHGQAPDCLKLVRSTEDAMTGIVYVDDCQVIEIRATKEWSDGESFARITVQEIAAAPAKVKRESLFGEMACNTRAKPA